MLIALALPAASVPPSSVTATSDQAGHPCSASTMVGTVVMRSSSMIRGLVNATYAPITVVGVRRLPWATPPGANRDGTRGRLPTAMTGSS